jgi:hypothetical protein
MAKRWYPGHFVQCYDQASRTTLTTERLQVANNPLITGYEIKLWWDTFETSFGVYNTAPLMAALNTAQADGKKVIIRFQERSFQGNIWGKMYPTYLDFAPYGSFTDNNGGQNIIAAKLWLPSVSDRYILAMEAIARAADPHPAFQVLMTEEYSIQGAWNQPDFDGRLMRQHWNEVARRVNPILKNGLLHVNTGWTEEPRTEASLAPYSDYLVSQNAGLGPTDLAYSSSIATLNTDFGRFIFSRHRDQTFFLLNYEWSSYFLPESPSFLIDWAYDTLRCHFLVWDADMNAANKAEFEARWGFDDVLAAIAAKNGKIYSTKPANVAQFDVPGGDGGGGPDGGGGGPVPGATPQPNVPARGKWFAKLTSGSNTWGPGTAAESTAVTWTTTTLPLGVVSSTYSATLAASGTGTISYSLTTGTLPTGLSLNGTTGVISGTPTQSGEFTLTFTATNGSSSPTTVLTMLVASAPVVTTSALPDGDVGNVYLGVLAATGTTPIAWAIVPGNRFPDGLTLDGNTGVVSGVPTRAETLNVIVRATNGAGSNTKSVSIKIDPAANPGIPQEPSGDWVRMPRDVEIWVRVPRDT